MGKFFKKMNLNNICAMGIKKIENNWHQGLPLNDLLPAALTCSHVPAGFTTIVIQ